MQDLQKVLSSLNNILVDLLSLRAWHALMPDVDDDQDVLHSHLLQQVKQLLATSFLVTVVKSLNDPVRLALFQRILALVILTHFRLVFLGFAESVGNDHGLSFSDLLSSLDEAHDHIHMDLLTDGC